MALFFVYVYVCMFVTVCISKTVIVYLLLLYIHRLKLIALCYYIDLMDAMKSSNHTVRNVSCMKYMVDIRKWISPHLEDMRYHTEQHIFLFKKNPSNKAAMYYKAWSHDDWEPSNDGLVILKVSKCNIYVHLACMKSVCISFKRKQDLYVPMKFCVQYVVCQNNELLLIWKALFSSWKN